MEKFRYNILDKLMLLRNILSVYEYMINSQKIMIRPRLYVPNIDDRTTCININSIVKHNF